MDVFGANPVDAVVLVVILASAVLAALRGFVAEILTLVGLVAAAAAVLYGMPYALPVAQDYLGEGLVAKGAAGAALFAGTLAVTSVLSFIISLKLRKTHLSAIDRSLGFLFGLLRGSILLCLLYICVTFIFPPAKEGEAVKPDSMQAYISQARTGPALAAGARVIASFAPDQGLSLDDLTKIEPVKELLQPEAKPVAKPADKAQPSEPSYLDGAREDLQKMIERTAP
jgi:membrane protein required for colicin V production